MEPHVTVRNVLSAMLRRWYIPLGVLLIAAVLLAAFVRDGGTYTTRTVVSFTYGTKPVFSYGSGANDANVIAFAGAIASEINDGKPVERYSDDSAPYFGAGVREGVLVGLTAAGNQWATSYPRADIEMQIVGRTREWVEARQSELVDKVLATAEARQSDSATDRVNATVIPLTLDIHHVTAGRTGLAAAVIAMLLSAVVVGAWGAVFIDGILQRRTTRPHIKRTSVPYPRESLS